MNIKASGRSALILATGLWLGFAGPMHAAGTGDSAAGASSQGTAQAPLALVKTTKHASHHLKKVAHRKSTKVADKAVADKKAAEASADEGDNPPTGQSAEIPASVANANAQLPASNAPADSAKAMSERASTILQATPDTPADAQAAAEAPVVAADQLNDVDRALRENTAPTASQAAVAVASAEEATAAPSVPAAAASSENSTWDQTSLIGKIFIGFGALLTMASAARMFMA
jgi:hypothetical protein